MIPERKAITEQVLEMSGADIAPRSTLEGPAPEPPRIGEPELLTRKDVARWLKCSAAHVSRLSIPCVLLGYRSPRYFRDDVLSWLNQQRTGGKQ